MDNNQNLSKIEEVALRTGFTKRALRYYEDIDLLHPIRKDSGYRLYAEEDVEKLIRIKELKESLGFSLNEVKDFLELENKLKDIMKESPSNPEDIKTSVEKIKNQIRIIEAKEETLEKVKSKYKEALDKIKRLLI